MYTQYFHLKQQPFSIAPDPRYLFMSERHREALAHLLYGVGSGGGFVLLTGEIGAGKTTVCRCFMEQIPDNCKLAYIFNPKLTVAELLQSVCDEFGIGQQAGSVKGYVDAINAYLLASHARGLNNVLVIDEAQNLSADVLEQLRLLTNLETSERKLLQIILIGQPELRTMLARPELEQLAQRVIARYHLGPLSEAEVGSYVQHRLAVAGAGAAELFPRPLLAQLHRLSKGVPRRINLLCDRALLGAYVENRAQVNAAILRRAAQEVFGDEAAPSGAGHGWRMAAGGVLAGGAAMALGLWLWMPGWHAAGGARSAAVKPNVAAARATAAVASAPAVAAVSAAAAAPAPEQPPAPTPVMSAAQAEPAAVSAELPPPRMTLSAALHELASKWGVQLAAGEGCSAAVRHGLRCLQTKGGLDEIRKLDRPVIVRLQGEAEQATPALLTALDGRSATLSIAGRTQQMPLDTLAQRFDGSFLTFWRAPRAWRDEVTAGDKGPDVDWLARRLAQLNNATRPRDNQPLEGDTLRMLREFQSGQNLKADGVAGPKTFIRLVQPGNETEPRLQAPAKLAAVAGK